MQTNTAPDFEFLLFEGFSNIVLSCAMEPLRDAKVRAARRRANWVVSTLDGMPVRSSSGLQVVPDRAFQTDKVAKRLVLVAGYGARDATSQRLQAALRAVARQSDALIALDSAPWILGDAGVLDGRSATIHWQELDEFAEAFPNVAVSDARFVRSGRIYTCGGASTVLDLMFEILSDLFGPETAFEASSMFLYSRGNGEAATTGPDFPRLTAQGSDALLSALDLISESLMSPMKASEIAGLVGVSERTLTRIFLKELQTTPGKFIVRYRLKQATYLSQSTNLTLAQIALRCGYGSAPALCRAYRDQFGETLRNRGRG